MPTERKIATVAELTDRMERMQLAVVADYRGLTVADLGELRKQLREHGAELIVTKNTLLRLAARQTGREAIEPLLTGPTAVAFAYDDVAKVAKTLDEYVQNSGKPFSVRGGLLGTTSLGADGLEQVRKMPSREQVLAQVLGGIQAPVTQFVGLIDAPVSDLVRLLDATASSLVYAVQGRIDQLQGTGAET